MENERLLSASEAVVATGNDELYDCWDSVEPVCITQDVKTTAARDKWWIDMVTLMMAGCRNKSCRVMTPDCEIGNNACMAWQSLISLTGEGK